MPRQPGMILSADPFFAFYAPRLRRELSPVFAWFPTGLAAERPQTSPMPCLAGDDPSASLLIPIFRGDGMGEEKLDYRLWRCPEDGCGEETLDSYEELADIGSPICPSCDGEMALVGTEGQERAFRCY